MDVISTPVQPRIAVAGGGEFPVRRIFCIGQNYAKHVREMGGDPKDKPPVFFTKPADAVVANGEAIPYPQGTSNLHFEGELVVALKSGGKDIADEEIARNLIFGYAAGCDLTRRDLQLAAKQNGAPWDSAKAFDKSAPIGALLRAGEAEELADAVLTTDVGGERRQHGPLSDMIWSVPEIIMALSRYFELKAGDLIFTGTPEGVGPVGRGETVKVAIDGLPTLEFSIL